MKSDGETWLLDFFECRLKVMVLWMGIEGQWMWGLRFGMNGASTMARRVWFWVLKLWGWRCVKGLDKLGMQICGIKLDMCACWFWVSIFSLAFMQVNDEDFDEQKMQMRKDNRWQMQGLKMKVDNNENWWLGFWGCLQWHWIEIMGGFASEDGRWRDSEGCLW